jgi:hypothetical protein
MRGMADKIEWPPSLEFQIHLVKKLYLSHFKYKIPVSKWRVYGLSIQEHFDKLNRR